MEAGAGIEAEADIVLLAAKIMDPAQAAHQLAPPSDWPHIASTLGFIRNHVEPVIGPVEVVSGFRNEDLNRCARGAPKSAHRHFYALDMVPASDLGRGELMRGLC